MESMRQQKFARLIQKELADLFNKEGRNFFGSSFITVTGVRVTPDLGLARVHLSIFKETDKSAVLDNIEQHHTEIRKKLGQRIRHQVRAIPELQFFIDNSMDYAEKMDQIFRDLNIPPQTD
ncbi:MAG TPA: 30S ribosome-binding factor RbfA [Bacteroidia bacterium]|nr:30S ribosome-binding factor RbfA [Bacteroidia bacterium]HNT79134.1 30S ribosome-binding factor RbfA [Bacteroidia bacterium]